jgi:shikimate dehydrogenase
MKYVITNLITPGRFNNVAADIGNLRCPLLARRVLLLGAGGAARGVSGPLLNARPATLVIANRTESRAEALALTLVDQGATGAVRGVGLDRLDVE